MARALLVGNVVDNSGSTNGKSSDSSKVSEGEPGPASNSCDMTGDDGMDPVLRIVAEWRAGYSSHLVSTVTGCVAVVRFLTMV